MWDYWNFFRWSPVCQLQFRSENVAFLIKMLGYRLDTTSYSALCVLLFRFALPVRWPVCCIGSNITSLCAVVRFATSVTGWINTFRLLFSSVTVFVVVVVNIVGIVFWDRVIGVTLFVSRKFLIVFSLFSPFVQQAKLVSLTSWLIAVVARWFGSVGFGVYGMLAHSVYL